MDRKEDLYMETWIHALGLEPAVITTLHAGNQKQLYRLRFCKQGMCCCEIGGGILKPFLLFSRRSECIDV